MNVTGKNVVYVASQTRLVAQLTDFNTGQANLQPAHKAFLLENAYPVLNKGGWVTVLGLASRLGGDQRNKQLSQNRSQAVSTFLKTTIPATFGVSQLDGVGEDYAAMLGIKDGNNDAQWRSVLLHAWSRQQPAPLPKQLPTPPRMVERVIERRWTMRPKMRGGFGELEGKGAAFSALGQDIAFFSGLQKRETGVRRQSIPINHAVNAVHVSVESYQNIMVSGETYVAKYEWGSPKQTVEIREPYSKKIQTLPRQQAQSWINDTWKMLFWPRRVR